MKLHELLEATTKYKERSILSVMGEQPELFIGDFFCTKKKLTSLKGSPKRVSGNFYCYYNHLESLNDGPSTVSDGYSCSNNLLTSLEGAPSKVGENFYCNFNRLTSLHNIHKHIKHVGGYIVASSNLIKSHVLGLLLIDGLKKVFLDNKQVQKIINKHLSGGRDVFACQEELIENGFEDFAQL